MVTNFAAVPEIKRTTTAVTERKQTTISIAVPERKPRTISTAVQERKPTIITAAVRVNRKTSIPAAGPMPRRTSIPGAGPVPRAKAIPSEERLTERQKAAHNPKLLRKILDEEREEVLGIPSSKPYYDATYCYDDFKNNSENTDPFVQFKEFKETKKSASLPVGPEPVGLGLESVANNSGTKFNPAAADSPIMPLGADKVLPDPEAVAKAMRDRVRRDEEREDRLGVPSTTPYFDREYFYQYPLLTDPNCQL